MTGLITSLLILTLNLLSPIVVAAHSQVETVKLTAEGFEPNVMTVDQGSTVIFVNQDTSPRWPASNVHPTHELYPEFDPKEPIKPGGSWSFRLDKVGEWKFHDHLFPHQRGSLIVRQEENAQEKSDSNLSAILERIKISLEAFIKKITTAFYQGWYRKPQKVLSADELKGLAPGQQFAEIEKLTGQKGVKDAWEYFLQVFKGQAGSSGNIHDLAHLVGSLAYEKEGLAGLKFCSPEFAFGCYHGFLDKAFEKDLARLNDALQACQSLGPGVTGPVASCIHGIGHGVASFYVVNDLKGSLSSCNNLTEGKVYCFDGVFMEFVRDAPASFFKKEDPLYPCNSLEEEFGSTYSFACGRNQPNVMISRLGFSFEGVVKRCLESGSQPFKEACFDSLGFIMAETASPEDIIKGCQSIGVSTYMAKCSIAAAGELVFQDVPNWQGKSLHVCNSLALQDRDRCLAHVDRLVKEYGKKKFRTLEGDGDPNGYIRDTLKVCYQIDGKDGCYKRAAQLLFDRFGLKKSLELLKNGEQNPEVYARCHEVTHYLSRFEYEKQKDVAKVYAQCDSTCHGGCYHGTLEAYLKEKDSALDSNLNQAFTKVCGKKEEYQKPLEYNECLHGLGHAAMFVTDMELINSLKLCDNLPDLDHRERCYTGVFMENSSSSTSSDHASKYIKADDPYYPCSSIDERYKPLCWQYQSSYFSIITHQDWKQVAKMCLNIPGKYQELCFRTIGTNQVGFTASLVTMKDDCSLMPSEHFQNVCVAGVISSLSYRFVGEAQKMIDFCLLVDSENQETCFRQMGTSLLDWDKSHDLAEQECSKIPNQQAKGWCLEVI